MSPRIFCYDTEFLEDGHTIDLISIGIVCSDRREYYAVNSDMDEQRIKKDDWLCQNVVPHLPVNNPPEKFENTWIWSLNRRSTLLKPKWVIANEVREFIAGCCEEGDTPFMWADHAAYDHLALAQLFGKMIHLPKGIPMYTHELQQLLNQIPGNWKPPKQYSGTKHHALDDARHTMHVYNAAMEALRDGQGNR
ncbi:3'-5' exoribonuclease domain-containing protein [Mycobacterium intracellulare]|uniref:3'-5' exoribonuclease domain-containing protein n=1 Tax=Mycobacterium intracellulare TaxID=1767 RepID=UPI00109E7867|nr:3'-5' exoribonuclease [Mycobacterium intracellulare]